MNFKQHYDNTRELFRLRKQQQPHSPDTMPHNMPVWHDINVYFRHLFRERTALSSRIYTVDELISDLDVFFGGKYDRGQIEKMLKTSYREVSPGCFEFTRNDFLPAKTQ